MNDFTKEELERLRWYLQKEMIQKDRDRDVDLLFKIQSMIENYCEHKECYTKLGITVCPDCNKEIKDENQ